MAKNRVCWLFTAAVCVLAGATRAEQYFAATPQPWTFLIYCATDNDAEGPVLSFLHALRKALADDPGVELLALVDRSEGHSNDRRLLGEDFTGTRLYRMRGYPPQRLSGGDQLPEIQLDADVELNTADAVNVQRFIAWGKAQYPARHTLLLIYSHANGRTMCPDEHADDDMDIAELSAKAGAAEHVDVLALELCNMAGIEAAYQWRPGPDRFGADVLIAIPNAGPPLAWDRAFRRIRSAGRERPAEVTTLDPATMTPVEFSKLVIEEGLLGRQRELASREAAGAFDLSRADEVRQALDGLGRALAASDTRTAFMELRDRAMNYGEPFVDLHDLCRQAASCERLPPQARSAAEAARDAVDRFVIASFGMRAYAGFEPGRNGVFAFVPPNRANAWREFAWLTPLAGAGKSYGRWSFLGDGARLSNGVVDNWFELLDTWFDEQNAAGGANGIRP